MAFELQDGQGTLHKVADKEGVESRPDYRGDLKLDGRMYRLAGWLKITKNGDRWISLNCELPRPKAALETPPAKKSLPRAPPVAPATVDPDLDIPF